MSFDTVLHYLKNKGYANFGVSESDIHPNDLVEIIAELDAQQKKELFLLLSEQDAATLVQEMGESDQIELIHLLTKERVSAILNKMDTDDATDLLGELSSEEADELLALVEEETKEDIEDLMSYPADSAGGIMTTDYIAMSENLTVAEAFVQLRKIAPSAEVVYYVYVTDSENKLKGTLQLRDLISSRDDSLLLDIMRRNLITVPVDMNQEKVAGVVSKYDLMAIPVTDNDGHLLGVITVDDVLDVLEEETTEDILHLAGAGKVQGINIIDIPVINLVKKRLPWLLIALFGGTLAGSVISAYETHLQSVIVLAVFIPMIMNMGGGVGTQSSTIAVRAIATGEMDLRIIWSYILHELKVGASLGFLNGVAIAVIATLWKGMPALGLVIGLATFVTLTVAALIGIMVPICSVRLKIDPAMTAGPFVTTIKDITALLVYFGIASLFMRYLV